MGSVSSTVGLAVFDTRNRGSGPDIMRKAPAERSGGAMKMTANRQTYSSEMFAALGAIVVFATVYVVGFIYAGAITTLLLGWLPAALLAWAAATGIRALMRDSVGDVLASMPHAPMAGAAGAPSRPATVSVAQTSRVVSRH